MTFLTVAQSRSFAPAASRPGVWRVPLTAWNAFLIAAVLAIGAWYLVQVNLTMSQSYRIRDAERRVAELGTALRSNQFKLVELETVGNLTAQAAALGMVPVGHVEYVSKPNAGVALR